MLVKRCLRASRCRLTARLPSPSPNCLWRRPAAVHMGPSPHDEGRKFLWIDCDAGLDDAQALLLALSDPTATILGISCVHGNVGVNQVVANVARILQLCNRHDVPIYKGACEPLVCEPRDASWFHGMDGLGDAPQVRPRPSEVAVQVSPGAAATKLVECAAEYDGQLTLIAIGPLTNVALACKLDPTFPSRLKRTFIMGSSEARGNVSPTAEFNYICDPEAAKVVMNKFVPASGRQPPLVVVSWECTIKHAVPWHVVERWRDMDTPKARFLIGTSEKSIAKLKSSSDGEAGFVTCDPVAVAAALQPEIITSTQQVHCDIEVSGSDLTRGMSVYDWGNMLKRPANVELVASLDMSSFITMLDQSLS